MKNLTALLAGMLFGVGLAMSGMTDTAKVIGFLDLFGEWVPDLAFVMGGAVLVTALLTRWVLGWRQPLFESEFHLPTKRTIDARLIGGAACFGVGWGLYGYCPGPAITALSYLNASTYVFVAAMLAGMAAGNRVSGAK